MRAISILILVAISAALSGCSWFQPLDEGTARDLNTGAVAIQTRVHWMTDILDGRRPIEEWDPSDYQAIRDLVDGHVALTEKAIAAAEASDEATEGTDHVEDD